MAGWRALLSILNSLLSITIAAVSSVSDYRLAAIMMVFEIVVIESILLG